MPLQYNGWAYVSCSSPGPDSAQGPTESIQFHSGSSVPGNSGLSGSSKLLYLTSSSELVLTGNLLVSGNIIARNFDVIEHTITFLSSSGDSKFGDTNEDWHTFTGSIAVKRIGVTANALTLTSSGPPAGGVPRVGIGVTYPYAALTVSGSQAVNYKSTNTNYSVTSDDYFVVVSVASKTSVTLPAASDAGRGRVVVVKAGTAAPDLTVSASGGDTIDGDAWQKLLSDYASETYVCDGASDWWII